MCLRSLVETAAVVLNDRCMSRQVVCSVAVHTTLPTTLFVYLNRTNDPASSLKQGVGVSGLPIGEASLSSGDERIWRAAGSRA